MKNKQSHFFRSKLISQLTSKFKGKAIAPLILIVVILTLPFLVFLTSGQSGPTFWNYEQHMNPSQERLIREDIGFNTFADLDALEGAIEGNKVAAAISSDYQAAKLVNHGKIQKIDFNKLWGFSNDPSVLSSQLQAIYTPFVFRTLDQAFTLDNGEKLWQYVIPYVVQQKVIAFNALRGTWTAEQKVKLNSVAGLNELFPDKSYWGILSKLREYGFKKLLVNDYVRDNMMIGSEISPGGFTSTPTLENYEQQINNFKKTIEEGFGQKFASNNVNFNSDGTAVLENLIDPSKDWDAAIMYNGDALDAYNAQDKFPTLTTDNFVRAIFPNNSINLVDVLIIPEYVTNKGNLRDYVYDAITQALFANGNATNLNDLNIKDPDASYPIALNFDYLYYSVAYKLYDQKIINEFFVNDEGQTDEIAKNIYTVILPTDNFKNHFAQAIDNALFTSIYYYYVLIKN